MKVDYDALDFDFDSQRYTYQGKPFTGVSIEVSKYWETVETTFLDGVMEGHYREWYQSGGIKEECFLHKGVIHGVMWKWNKEGELVEEAIYELGIRVKENMNPGNPEGNSDHFKRLSQEGDQSLSILRQGGRELNLDD
ncbi:MAG: hypothetical protein AAF206_08870 [Bacteroidota bacterium]